MRTVPELGAIGEEGSSNVRDVAVVPNIDILEGPLTFREYLRAFCLARQARKRAGLPNLQEIVPEGKRGRKKQKSLLK